MNTTIRRTNRFRAPVEDDGADLKDDMLRAMWIVVYGFFVMVLLGAGITIYVALSWRAAAEEPRVEILGGQCQYAKVGNYVWFNEHYDHQLDMTSGCGMLAISKITGRYGRAHLGWRLAYVDMGAARTNAVFPMLDPEQPFHPSGANCNPATWQGCIGRGVGVQTARGISAGVVAEFDVWRARLGAELGLFAYEGIWRVSVQPEPPSNFAAYSVEWRGPQATPLLGATARYGYGLLMVRGYSRIRAAEHGCVGCSGVAGKTAKSAFLGLSIPF